jgi:lysozyme
MDSFYLDAIRKFEGFATQARWDYAQFTNGYGTRAQSPGEVVDRAEAERRFRSEITNARAIVERQAPALDEGTKAALTSLTYNTGASWVNSGLGEAARGGNLDQVRALFCQYCKAGGEVVPGLVSRRAAEALWIGNTKTAGADAGAPEQPSVSAELSELIERRASGSAGASGLRSVTPVSEMTTRGEVRGGDDPLQPADQQSGLEAYLLSIPSSLSDIVRLVRLDSGHRLLASDKEPEHPRNS